MVDPADILASLVRIEALLGELVGLARGEALEPAATPNAGPALEALRERCRVLRIAVRADGTVGSAEAARLLGIREQTLRADRCYFGRIPSERSGRLIRYRLEDLAGVVVDRL